MKFRVPNGLFLSFTLQNVLRNHWFLRLQRPFKNKNSNKIGPQTSCASINSRVAFQKLPVAPQENYFQHASCAYGVAIVQHGERDTLILVKGAAIIVQTATAKDGKKRRYLLKA